jgi:ABC-type uncharacterized transport system permease subunit
MTALETMLDIPLTSVQPRHHCLRRWSPSQQHTALLVALALGFGLPPRVGHLAVDLSHQVVENLVHVDLGLGRCLQESAGQTQTHGKGDIKFVT